MFIIIRWSGYHYHYHYQVVKVAKVAYRALNLCGLATFDMIVQARQETGLN